MKADYNNEDNFKINSECKQIFNKLIKTDYFHDVDYIEDFIAKNCYVQGTDDNSELKKSKNINTFIHEANYYLGFAKKGLLGSMIFVLC